jgi:hypothetical protein
MGDKVKTRNNMIEAVASDSPVYPSQELTDEKLNELIKESYRVDGDDMAKDIYIKSDNDNIYYHRVSVFYKLLETYVVICVQSDTVIGTFKQSEKYNNENIIDERI